MSDCWSGVPLIREDKPCDICKSDGGVHHQMVEVNQGGCVKSLFSHVQSSLCLGCIMCGWIIFGKADPSGKISYYNTATQEFKHSE